MVIHMSKSFAARWKEARLDDVLASIALQPRLGALVAAPFVRKGGGLLLEPLAAEAAGPEAFPDRTAYEAFINKVPIDDFIDDAAAAKRERLPTLVQQGTKAAVALADRLAREGRYRVLLSLDPEMATMTLRFFERREREPWGVDDPDAHPLEEVLMIDSGT
jgi:hypothetical protein